MFLVKEKMPGRKAIISTNRCSTAFKKVLDDEIRANFLDKDILFTYHRRAEHNKIEGNYSKIIRFMGEDATFFDSKINFGKIFNGCNFVPRTYFSIDEIKKYGYADDKLFFVKYSKGANGRNVRCVKWGDLKMQKLGHLEIVQEAVTDIDLIDECKYVVRTYILFFNGKVWYYNDGVVIKHALKYDNSTSHAVQINHKGYLNLDSSITLTPFSRLNNYKKILKNIADIVPHVKNFGSYVVESSKKGTFVLYGIDIIVEKDMSVKLIEMNSLPNLTQTIKIRKEVNYKLINNLLRVVSGMNYDGFIEV